MRNCTSYFYFQPRSGTFSSGLSRISSPISTSRHCRFSKESPPSFSNQICEECEQPEPQGFLPRCDSCGNCLSFEVKQDLSGMKNMKLDENRNEVRQTEMVRGRGIRWRRGEVEEMVE